MEDKMHEEYDEDEYKAFKFLEGIFGPPSEEPAVIRNKGCKFTEKVIDYLFFEWELDVIHYSHDIQNKIMDMLDVMKERGESVPNTAARISMEVIPI
jgi:hypothetical protein